MSDLATLEPRRIYPDFSQIVNPEPCNPWPASIYTGLLAFVVTWFAGNVLWPAILGSGPMDQRPRPPLFPEELLCVPIMAFYLAISISRRVAIDNAAAAHAKKRNELQMEAEMATKRARHLLNWGMEAKIGLRGRLCDASAEITHAHEEFEANAYGPFWDAVERAANSIGDFQEDVRSLGSSVEEYYQILKGRIHTFGPFLMSAADIPDSSGVIADLMMLVRRGQTSFSFANIWEHRQTRVSIVRGFNTLGEAIHGLQAAIAMSRRSLVDTISSQTAAFSTELAATRELIDRHASEIIKQLKRQ